MWGLWRGWRLPKIKEGLLQAPSGHIFTKAFQAVSRQL